MDHLVAARIVHHLGDDGRAPRRQLVDGGHLQIGVVAHGQRAGDGGGRHHQQVRLQPALNHLRPESQALRHAKAVLLVDDGQRQVFELHLVLNDGVRADDQPRLAAGDQRQHLAPLFGLLAAGEPRGFDAQRLQPANEFAKVLLGQNFGGRHQRALPAGVDADGSGQRGHHGFAGAHVALQQAVHGDGPGDVVGNFGAHALLSGGEGEGHGGQQAGVQRRVVRIELGKQ